MHASSAPRDVIDGAVTPDRSARRSGGKLTPDVSVCFAMAMPLFAEDGYEKVDARPAGARGSSGAGMPGEADGGAARERREHISSAAARWDCCGRWRSAPRPW